MKPVASTNVDGLVVRLLAGEGCALVRAGSSQQAFGGGCGQRPSSPPAVSLVTSTLALGPPSLPPPWAGTSVGTTATVRPDRAIVVVARVTSEVQAVRALLVDGESADAVLGPEGWALVATTGRPYLLEAYDGGGRRVGEVLVS